MGNKQADRLINKRHPTAEQATLVQSKHENETNEGTKKKKQKASSKSSIKYSSIYNFVHTKSDRQTGGSDRQIDRGVRQTDKTDRVGIFVFSFHSSNVHFHFPAHSYYLYIPYIQHGISPCSRFRGQTRGNFPPLPPGTYMPTLE